MVRALIATAIALSIIGLAGGCAPVPRGSVPAAQVPPQTSDVAAGGSNGTQQASLPAVLPPRPADLVPVIKELARLNSDNMEISKVEDIRTAKDSQGTWWVSARVTPASSARDIGRIYLTAEADRWVVRYLGNSVGEAGLPADVRDRL